MDSSIQGGVLPLDLVPSEWFTHRESQSHLNHTHQLTGQKREGGSCGEGDRESGDGGKPG